MPLTRKPAIDDARIGDRKAQTAVANIRQRLEAIEALLTTIESQANQSSFQLSRSNASVNSTLQRLARIEAVTDELINLLAVSDGFVVASDGQLVTRTLVAGTGISITNEDGTDGNPTISATAECCYPFLTTELDDDILTEDGHRIRVE